VKGRRDANSSSLDVEAASGRHAGDHGEGLAPARILIAESALLGAAALAPLSDVRAAFLMALAMGESQHHPVASAGTRV